MYEFAPASERDVYGESGYGDASCRRFGVSNSDDSDGAVFIERSGEGSGPAARLEQARACAGSGGSDGISGETATELGRFAEDTEGPGKVGVPRTAWRRGDAGSGGMQPERKTRLTELNGYNKSDGREQPYAVRRLYADGDGHSPGVEPFGDGDADD